MEGSSSEESNLWKTLKIISEWELGKYFCRFFLYFIFTVFYRHSFRAKTHTHNVYFTVKRSFFDKRW